MYARAISICGVEVAPIRSVSITHRMDNSKPSMDDVLKYAKPLIHKFIGEHACDVPTEQKEEIFQEANLRVIEAYADLDADKGWKSFVYNHCRGAVLDYLKAGEGFQEQRWSIAKEEEHGSRHVFKIRDRLNNSNHDNEEIDIDHVLGANGIFSSIDFDIVAIDWNLVAKMASSDEALHVFAKYLRGFTIEELVNVFSVSRSRIQQLLAEFINRFDDPSYIHSPWFSQCIWALGLARHFGIADRDQSLVFGMIIGHSLIPVNLDSQEPFDEVEHVQMSFL